VLYVPDLAAKGDYERGGIAVMKGVSPKIGIATYRWPRLLAISVVLALLAGGAWGQQLLSNNGFETWSGAVTADYWTSYTTTGTVTCYKGTTFTGSPSVSAHGGTQFQRVRLTSSGAQGGVYQRFASTPGVQYTVSAWLLTRLTSATSVEAKLGVDPTGATTPGANTTWSSTVTGDSAWTQKSLTVTATGSYITVFLDGRHPTADTNQCNAFFDDASAAATCTPPNPPTSGTATANSVSQITWGWTRASGATGEVYRAYDASSGGNLKWTSGSQATSYAEGSLSTNTLYGTGAASGYQRHLATYLSCESSTRLALPAKYTLQASATTPTFGTLTTSSIVLNTTGPVNLTAGSSGVIFKRNGTTDLTKVQALTTTDSSLAANTSYSYTARGVNGDNVATAESSSAAKFTLAKAPTYGTSGDVTIQCDCGQTKTDCTASQNITFTFNNAFGSGAANVGKFTYKWDTSSTWDGTSPTDWSSGATLVKQAGAAGTSYYLHLRSWNNDSTKVENATTLNLGPYTVPVASGLLNGNFESWTGSSTADYWTSYTLNGTISCAKGTTWSGDPAVSPHGGSQCQRISFDAFNESGGIYQRFASTAGTQYTVSGWLLTRIGGSCEVEAMMGVDPTGATTPGGNTIWSDKVVYNSSWTQKTLNVTAQGSYVTVFFYGWHPHSDTSTNGIFVDDVTASVNGCTPPSAPTSPAATPSTLCFGSVSVLSASVSGGCTVDWHSGTCYGPVVGSGTSLGVTPLSTTSYYARARNTTTGCESTSCAGGVTVTVNSAPSVPTSPAANPTTVASGGSSTLSATVAGGCTVDWYSGSCGGTLVGSGTSLVVNPVVTTNYYAVARNTTTGCCNISCAEPVTVTVSGAAGVSNGGFETWSGTTVADYWTQYATTGSVTGYKGSTFAGTPSVSAYSGTECQRVKIAGSSYEGGVYQRISSTNGTQYTVTAYLLTRLTNATAVEAKLGVDTSGATTPGGSTTWSSVVSGDSSWTAKTVNVTATGSYITIFLDGKHPTADTNQCNVFFDGVSVSAPIPPATRYVKYHASGTWDGTTWANAFNNIGDALAMSNSGDQIWVAADTYAENVRLKSGVALYGGFAGTETLLSQRDWNANLTTIDGRGADSVITVARTASTSTRVDGFTITNGRAVQGGGIYISQSASPVIANNIIKGNHADCDGGGIFANYGCSPVIATNTIKNNGAMGYGGGICAWTGSTVLTNNIVACNSAANGGGICCGDPNASASSSETIVNNTIYGNSAVSGGGVTLRNLSSAHLHNNIIAYNSTGIYKMSGSGAPVLSKNDLYSNPGYNYSGLSAGSGDITSNPLLASSVYGQVHIQPTSPCKDVGDNASVIGGYYDMDNQTRIQNTTVDMGADESDGTTWTVSAPTIRVKTDGSDSNDGSTWALAKQHIQAAVNAAAAAGGGELWVKAGTYSEQVDLIDGVYIYGGFAGSETSRTQRNWTTNVTIIDGGSARKGVEAVGLGYRLSALDGFKIQNGKAWDGAGVFCMNAAPQIMNNTITANAARGKGGGVFLANSLALVRINDINQNSALGYGGGVAAMRGYPEVSRDNIENNWACIAGAGGYISGGCTGRFINNRIVLNHQNTTISGCYGMGLALGPYTGAVVINNTFADNEPGSSTRGTIYTEDYAVGTFANNIIAMNGSGGFSAGINGSLTLTKNDVYSNSGQDYYAPFTPISHATDISSDPLFHNQAGADYRQSTGSPVINTADSGSAPSDDYLGVTRSTPDMGCYEWQSGWGFSAPLTDGGKDKQIASTNGSDVSSAELTFALGRLAGGNNDEILLYTQWPDYAENMNLYVSADGETWELSDIEVKRGEAKLEIGYGTARFAHNGDAYYAFTAVGPDGESRMGPVIHARPADVEFSGVTITAPLANETGVANTPTLAWRPSWTQPVKASSYQCEVDRVVADNDWKLEWLVRTATRPPLESLTYGQNRLVRTLFRTKGPLADLAEYAFTVLAVDKENWAFAMAPPVRFATAGF
jgi:hypothetical protein